MIANNEWRWPTEWSVQYPMLANFAVQHLVQEEDDTMWNGIDGSLSEFSSKVVWEHINHQHGKVRWNKVVWFSQCNPRMAFILWMAIKRKTANTREDREVNDSHGHLFFECDYSKTIWEELKVKVENE